MIKQGIQCQLGYFDSVNELRSFLIAPFNAEGHEYQTLGPSKNTDLLLKNPPIGVVLGGGQFQMDAIEDGETPVQLMIYYYRKIEGKYSLILDAFKK